MLDGMKPKDQKTTMRRKGSDIQGLLGTKTHIPDLALHYMVIGMPHCILGLMASLLLFLSRDEKDFLKEGHAYCSRKYFEILCLCLLGFDQGMILNIIAEAAEPGRDSRAAIAP
jgi:hypothetical protein